MGKTNIGIIGLLEEAENIFKEIIARNFPNPGKQLDIQVQKSKRPQITLLSQCKKTFSKTHYNDTVKNQ